MTLTSPLRVKSLTGKGMKLPAVQPLKDVTVRSFDGGWNVIDSDLVLESKYAKVLDNLLRAADGTLQLRFGTLLLHDFADIGMSDLVACRYFNTFLIVVDNEGRVGAGRADGAMFLIWDDSIAVNLSGNPLGWNQTNFASFAEFKSELVVCNGRDKPLLIPANLATRYLQDLGTGSNANTPICRYVLTHDEYLVMAGDPFLPSTLHIAARATSGTFVGDPAPNDAITFDVAPWVTQGSSEILGIGSFRDKLVVNCAECILIITLGNYTGEDADVHTPSVDDVIPNYGTIGHNTIKSLGDDMLFMDLIGVPSVQRALFTQNISPVRESQLIDPAIQDLLKELSSASLQDRCFSVYDKLSYTTLFFVPNADEEENTTETICFAYRNIRALKVRAWARLRGWNWRSGTTTAEGRVVFTEGTRTFLYGNEQSGEQYDADLIGYAETYSDGTVHTDGTGWTPYATLNADGTDRDYRLSGLPITFDWQLPWSDLKKRTRAKISKYLKVETTGRGRFTAQMFIDNILTPQQGAVGEPFTDDTLFSDGYGWHPGMDDYDPQLSIELLGGDRGGFGAEEFSDYFGGGRITSDERLLAWPCKFNIFKLRMTGTTRGPLRFVSLSMYYHQANVRR